MPKAETQKENNQVQQAMIAAESMLGTIHKKIPENAFTIAQFAVFKNMSDDAAYRRLTRLAQDEKLETGIFVHQGRQVRFFWPKV